MARPDLFPEAPRRAPVKRMHVIDAGETVIAYKCGWCGYETGWVVNERTVSENRRGVPCPVCNRGSAGDD